VPAKLKDLLWKICRRPGLTRSNLRKIYCLNKNPTVVVGLVVVVVVVAAATAVVVL